MEYTHLGRIGLLVSRICLGTMNFGPQTKEEDSFSIMDSAPELGVNFFDSANVYGGDKGRGATEEIVGRWLAQGGGRRDNIVLASRLFLAPKHLLQCFSCNKKDRAGCPGKQLFNQGNYS